MSCPYTAGPGYRTGDRIYAEGMSSPMPTISSSPAPRHFYPAVIDAGDLPLTASREGLQESATLQFARNDSASNYSAN